MLSGGGFVERKRFAIVSVSVIVILSGSRRVSAFVTVIATAVSVSERLNGTSPWILTWTAIASESYSSPFFPSHHHHVHLCCAIAKTGVRGV